MRYDWVEDEAGGEETSWQGSGGLTVWRGKRKEKKTHQFFLLLTFKNNKRGAVVAIRSDLVCRELHPHLSTVKIRWEGWWSGFQKHMFLMRDK